MRHCNDLDERVGHAVEIEQLRRRRVFLGLGGILLQLDLFDVHADPVAIFWGNAVVVEEVDVAMSRKRLCDESVRSHPGRKKWIPTIVLCDLIPRRLILVKVVFPVKPADGLNLAFQRNGSAQGREEGGRLEFLYRMSPCPRTP